MVKEISEDFGRLKDCPDGRLGECFGRAPLSKTQMRFLVTRVTTDTQKSRLNLRIWW